MLNPIDWLVGRVEAKANRKVYDVKVDARRAAEGKVRAAAAKGQQKIKGGKAPPAEAKKKKKMGWWPFGKDEDGQPPGCPGCGAEVDPSWPSCPYCQTSLAGGAAAPAAGGPPVPNTGVGPGPGGGEAPVMISQGNRTMAIDLDALGAPQKPVRGWLVVVEGQQKGTDYRLYEGSNRIGAGADNDIVVTDDYLSTHHCSIRIEDNIYEFIDNGSTNGSYVNDRRISKEEVIDNDRLRLGRTEFRIKTLLEY